MSESDYFLGFSMSPGVGPIVFQKLLSKFKTAKKIWDSDERGLRESGLGEAGYIKFDKFRQEFDSRAYDDKLTRAKVEFIPFSDSRYPKLLREIKNPPIGLFAKGNISILKRKNMIGVVGARKATSYGKEVTEKLVEDLVMSDFVIVSGLAYGIDAISHKACLESDGLTIAVLGCGTDCCFPRENENLYHEIIDKKGLIISEYPLGLQPTKGTFPARNRIISGLSLGVLVTEAGRDSGSLITAEEAVNQGRKVFAVPGPITSRMSDGTTGLIKKGAVLVSSTEDIITVLNIKNQRANAKNLGKNLNVLKLSKDEKRVYRLLANEEFLIDALARRTNTSVTRLTVVLSGLELKGLVQNNNGKWGLKN